MRLSRLFAPTLKETPKEAEVASHKLLLRAGYIRKLAAGIYDFLPLGLRAIQKVEAILRDELGRAGAQEVLMPAVQPASLWKESGRWDFYGPELLRFKDRKGGDFCLGPTHEEVITDMVRGEVRSYRQLPVNLYQIQTKFRDEMRPRAGLMRGREFIMKDGYSFDVSVEAATASYEAMYEAYCRIFARCGLAFRPVEADTGNIGGSLSHEFQVLAETGEDAIVSCPSCNYTANVEKAALAVPETPAAEATSALERVDTPGARTVEEVAAFFSLSEADVVKTVLFVADDQPVAVLMRGDLEINEVKVKAALGADTMHLANEKTVRELTGAPVGFAGPVGLEGVRIIADHSVRAIGDGVVGANEADAHYRGFAASRDAADATYHDLRLAGDGDPCGRCGAAFTAFRGIEVGHVFLLGTKYSEPLKATFLDEDGKPQPMVMGCYGIGVTRVLSAAIEQNHDDKGIIWPMALAPYHVLVAPLQLKDEEVVRVAESIYAELQALGVEVMIDDRDLRPGNKFADADLYGIPIRITVGSRGLKQGMVELVRRGEEGRTDVPVDAIVEQVATRVREELAASASAASAAYGGAMEASS